MSKKSDRLASRALSTFEQAQSDLLEAARLQAEEAKAKHDAASALAHQSVRLRDESAANNARAAAIGDLLGL